MNPELKQDLQRHLQLEYVTSYTDHGCNICGPLVVVRCTKAWEAHPRYGEFASMSCYDVADAATDLIGQAHPEVTREDKKLGIPDVVVRLSQESWEKGQNES